MVQAQSVQVLFGSFSFWEQRIGNAMSDQPNGANNDMRITLPGYIPPGFHL